VALDALRLESLDVALDGSAADPEPLGRAVSLIPGSSFPGFTSAAAAAAARESVADTGAGRGCAVTPDDAGW
jgi:hypothetical protein